MANELSCSLSAQTTTIGASAPCEPWPVPVVPTTGCTIYVLTSGAYSDYSIKAVFSTKALAEQYIAKANDKYRDWNTVEEWVLDELVTKQNIKVWYIKVWCVGIALDTGEVLEQNEFIRLRQPFRGRVTQANIKVPFYGSRLMARVESGVSGEHALKLAYEARQKYLRNEAFSEGLVDWID